MNLKNEPVSKDIFNKFNENIKKNKIYNQDVHIRLQQRNGRKSLTTVQGLNYRYDHEKILKSLKKEMMKRAHLKTYLTSRNLVVALNKKEKTFYFTFFFKYRDIY